MKPSSLKGVGISNHFKTKVLEDPSYNKVQVRHQHHVASTRGDCFTNADTLSTQRGHSLVIGWVLLKHQGSDAYTACRHAWNADRKGKHYDTTPFPYPRPPHYLFSEKQANQEYELEQLVLASGGLPLMLAPSYFVEVEQDSHTTLRVNGSLNGFFPAAVYQYTHPQYIPILGELYNGLTDRMIESGGRIRIDGYMEETSPREGDK